jgi:two-component system chemotaxis response regulator CheY
MKALIVDDSEFQRSEVREILRQEGFECIEAVDGLEALKQIESTGAFDFIVTDLNMPRMNGLEFVERARSLEWCKQTPIFMLTTDVTTDSKNRGKEIGLTAWILKPLKAEPFIKTVRKVMERKAAG